MSNHRAAHIKCSECSTVVPNTSGKRLTCSDRCRALRSRRLREQRAKNLDPGPEKLERDQFKNAIGDKLSELVIKAGEDLVQTEVQAQLGDAIQRITRLTPVAIARLELDLRSDDARIAQRAAELLLKYSVPPAGEKQDSDGDSNIVVNFNLPRPDADAKQVEAEAIELRVCEICAEEKPTTAFQDGSERCKSCHEDLKQLAVEKFGSGA